MSTVDWWCVLRHNLWLNLNVDCCCTSLIDDTPHDLTCWMYTVCVFLPSPDLPNSTLVDVTVTYDLIWDWIRRGLLSVVGWWHTPRPDLWFVFRCLRELILTVRWWRHYDLICYMCFPGLTSTDSSTSVTRNGWYIWIFESVIGWYLVWYRPPISPQHTLNGLGPHHLQPLSSWFSTHKSEKTRGRDKTLCY